MTKTVTILDALSDETRLSIVRQLSKHASPVLSCNLVTSCGRALDLSQPTISHHLKKLVNADVISEQKIGKQKLYALNTDCLLKIGIDATKL